MIALLLAFVIFLLFGLIGFAFLAAMGADTTSARVALTAPALGSTMALLPLFALSRANVALADGAVPLSIALAGASIAVLLLRRPALPEAVAPIAAIGVVALLLAGWPMAPLGFRWIANANDDMANYVLSATRLLHQGLLSPLDASGLAQGRDYATAWRIFPAMGARPGADILLSATSAVVGRPPVEVFMPLLVALHLCGVFAVGALALQASRRKMAAVLATALIAISPLATFGVVQQLPPQVWGLGIAAALLALLARPELHRSPGARVHEIVPIGVLFTGILLVYIELAATIVVAYLAYVVVLALRRQLGLRATTRLWLSAIATAALLLNTYLLRELSFVSSQATHGTAGGGADSPFGFVLTPSALPGLVGLKILPSDPGGRWLSLAIAVAAILLAGVLVLSVATAYRGNAAALVLLVYAGIALVLARKGSDFGVFKLFMYVQPFLAAATAVWLCRLTRGLRLAIGASALAALVAAQLYTQHSYVSRSLNPVDLTHASAVDLLPAFRRFVRTEGPLVSAADNPTLGKLEAASAGGRPLYLISRNIFATLPPVAELDRIERLAGWKPRVFPLLSSGGPRATGFSENTLGSAVLAAGPCTIVLPTGSQSVMNRRVLPEGAPDLIREPCAAARNVLVFTNSDLGQHFYLYEKRRAVSFYQLERDYFFAGRTLAGFGRYTLFRVLRPSSRIRLQLAFTTTLRQDGSNRLPPAAVVGARRASLPVVGRGSARVFSLPLRTRAIAGEPYVLLDMGVAGRPLPVPRSGLQAMYGRSIVLDPRYLTSYVRDISLVSDVAYRELRAPFGLRRFPADLANPNLEYSGIYEDGWVAEDSYAMLAAGGRKDLLIRADVLATRGRQRLDVRVNGQRVASRNVSAGAFELRVPLPPSSARRRVELRWAEVSRLQAPDRRPAAALLKFVGLVPPSRG